VVLLLHGSAGSSASVHALAKGLAQQGPRLYTHWMSEDTEPPAREATSSTLTSWTMTWRTCLLGFARDIWPSAHIGGFSATGGLALRMAASPRAACSTATCCWPHIWVPLRRRSAGGGGWAQVSMPRIVALTALSSLAIRKGEGLTVVRYAVNPAAPFRLLRVIPIG